jgi:hypothetical protein
MDDNREDRIRARAYALWEAEGCPEGRHAEHWHQAERDVDAAAGSSGAVDEAASGADAVPSGSADIETLQTLAEPAPDAAETNPDRPSRKKASAPG